jgi:membrane fusion protein, multidrug efflux system
VKQQHIVSAAILVVVVSWMIIPRDSDSNAIEQAPEVRSIAAIPEGESAGENPGILTVRAVRLSPQPYTEKIRVRGRTQASRHVQVRAEEAGRIISDPIARGARVSEGDVLCEIAMDNRETNLMEAESRLEQAQFEYDASVDLQQRGLQSDVVVAQLKAALQSSRAAIARAELSITKTKIRAPFDGVVETRVVENGDLLNIGTVCASVLDDSPMLLIGLVPEQNIDGIEIGARVGAELINGSLLSGSVSYLSRAADTASRSYRIEIEVDPQFEGLREGITVELLVDAEELTAHMIPSSALTLDDNGVIGVKTIDNNNMVNFRNIEIVGDNTNQLDPGVWVTGLSGKVSLITIGQEIVFPGQQVEGNYDWSN